MAVATSTAIIGGLGVAKGIYDTASAGKRQKQHQSELDAYQRQELTNAYKDMQISTIGSDAMREESSRNIATAMNTIGNAGTRAIIGATPKLVADQNNVNRNIQKELDDQVIKRNYAIAGDETRIQQMQEAREQQDLAGLGNAIDTARQDKNMGMNTVLNSLMAVGSSIEGTTGENPQVKPVSTLTPISALNPIGMQKTTIANIQAPQYQSPTPRGIVPQGPLNYDFQTAPNFMNNFNSIGFAQQNSFNLNKYMDGLKPVKF